MCRFLKKALVFLILIILVCSFSEIKADGKEEPKITFKLTEPIIYTIMFNDKHANDIEAKVTFQEYNPPLEINQTFGLEWKDLDFLTVEQVYLGFELCQTKGQYLSLYHGSAKKDMEKIYLEEYPNLFEQDMKESEENPLYVTWYSKCMIEIAGQKYVLAKRQLKVKDEKFTGVVIYSYVGKKWKYSDQFEENFPNSSFDFFVAYEKKSTPEFLEWLKKQQTKAEIEKNTE